MKLLTTLMISLFVIFFPFASFAETVSVDEMKKNCTEGFMKDADKTSDPAMYKNYITKMCSCAAEKIGGKDVDQNAVMVSMGSCMGLTLLTETMNTLKDTDVTEENIKAACMKQWQTFTSTKKNQGTLEKTCECSAKEIMNLGKDQRFTETELDKVSTICLGKDS